MPTKNALLLTALMTLALPSLMAQNAPVQKRSLTQGGVGVSWKTVGEVVPGVGAGWSLVTFLSSSSDDTLYYGVMAGGYVNFGSDGLTISDTKVVQLGWRPALWGTVIHFDMNTAPVLGARYQGGRLLSSFYTGWSAGLGLFAPLLPGFDLGVSLESVVNLYNWGAPPAGNLSYTNVAVSLVSKSVTESRDLPW
jgi:hypothetical protein